MPEEYDFRVKMDELRGYVEDLGVATSRFIDAGIDSQGAKARKILQSIKKLSQELRLEIQNTRSSRKE